MTQDQINQITNLAGVIVPFVIAVTALIHSLTHAATTGDTAHPVTPVVPALPLPAPISADIQAILASRTEILAVMSAAFTATIATLEAAGDTAHAAQLRAVQGIVVQVATELANSTAATT